MQFVVEGDAQVLTRYIEAAMRHAQTEWLEQDGVWYSEIPMLPSVWATAETPESARSQLQEVLEDWVALGLSLNRPLPAIQGGTSP